MHVGHTLDIRKSSRSRAIGRRPLERLTRRVVQTVLDGEGLVAAEVGVWFVDDPTIRRLNRRYRRLDRPTDVMAFELSDPPERRRPGAVLGDVVISVTTAHRQAASLGHPLEVELALLIVHGVLHLLGCDHDRPSDAARMRRKERAYLAACKVRSIRQPVS